MPSRGRVPAEPHSDHGSIFSILPSSLLVIWWDMSKEAAETLRNGQLNSFYSSTPSLAISAFSTLSRCCQQTRRQFKELQSVLDKHRKIMLCFSSPIRIQLPPKMYFTAVYCSSFWHCKPYWKWPLSSWCTPTLQGPSAGRYLWMIFVLYQSRISLWYLLNNNHSVLFCLVPAASEVKVSQHFSQNVRQ